MKTTKALILLALTLNFSPKAWSETPRETANEINAQTEITRGQIDNLLEQVNQRKADSLFKASDYQAQAQETKNKIEATLKTFEDTVEKDILAKASYWMNQYNSIYSSKSYSDDQKKIVLAERLANIQNEFMKLSADYQKALSKVYELVPYANIEEKYSADPLVGKYKTSRDSEDSINLELILSESMKVSVPLSVSVKERTKKSDLTVTYKASGEVFTSTSRDSVPWIKYNGSPLFGNYYKYMNIDYTILLAELSGLKNILKREAFRKYYYPALRKKCQSTICLGLVAGDYSSLLAMIQKLINRSMQLTLASGQILLIEGKKDINAKFATELLTRVDYPEELPFDL